MQVMKIEHLESFIETVTSFSKVNTVWGMLMCSLQV